MAGAWASSRVSNWDKFSNLSLEKKSFVSESCKKNDPACYDAKHCKVCSSQTPWSHLRTSMQKATNDAIFLQA